MSETLDLLEEVLDENELAALIEKASASKDQRQFIAKLTTSLAKTRHRRKSTRYRKKWKSGRSASSRSLASR